MSVESKELVSVILPVYNSERYIKETIKSVLGQTYKNFELIVIDDCSTDGSTDIIKSFMDERIRYLKNKKNGGVAASRNNGMKFASGRYVAFIDSDDVWGREKLAQQIKQLSTSNYVMSYTGLEIIDEENRHIKNQHVPREMTYKKLLRNTAIATSSVVLDMSKIDIDINMPNRRTGEDYVTWLSILRNCGNAVGIDKGLVRYRKTSNGLSSNRLDSFSDLWYGQHIVHDIGIAQFMLNYICFAFNAVKKHYF